LYTTTSGISYQWYLAGVAILGATNSSYNATINGMYTVRAYYANGCNQLSNELSFAVGVVDELAVLQGIEVFPNPTNGILNLRTASPVRKTMEVVVTDMYGREVYRESVRNLRNEFTMDLTALPAGVYMLSLKTTEASTMHKIVLE
jgi:hypothetical protein